MKKGEAGGGQVTCSRSYNLCQILGRSQQSGFQTSSTTQPRPMAIRLSQKAALRDTAGLWAERTAEDRRGGGLLARPLRPGVQALHANQGIIREVPSPPHTAGHSETGGVVSPAPPPPPRAPGPAPLRARPGSGPHGRAPRPRWSGAQAGGSAGLRDPDASRVGQGRAAGRELTSRLPRSPPSAPQASAEHAPGARPRLRKRMSGAPARPEPGPPRAPRRRRRPAEELPARTGATK